MWILMANMALGAPPTLLTVESAATSPVAATWTVEGCFVRLRLQNGGDAPAILAWERSAYAPAGGAAVPLVPGTSSKFSSMIAIPPMVVPPGGYAEELVFRKDRLPSDSDGCLFTVPSDATVTLSVGDGWLTQTLHFRVDEAAAERERQAVLEAERLRHRAACLKDESDLQRRARRSRMWSYVAGAGGLAVGAINLGLGASQEVPEQMIGGGVLAGAGVGTFAWLQIRGGALARRAEILGCDRI